MGRALFHWIGLCAALGIISLGCGSEGDGPTKPPPSPVIRYHAPSAPESTVLNYARAWENRDSVMIDSLISDDYEGTSVDMTDPTPSTLTFFKSDEARALGGIQLDPNVSSVQVDLSPLSASVDPGDPPTWVTVSSSQALIQIFRSGYDDLRSTGSHEFKLKPITPASNSPTDTAWVIVRWMEVHN